MAREADEIVNAPLTTDRTVVRPITPDQRSGKNLSGELGPVCNTCGGLGWTMVLGGGTKNCTACDETGIATMTRLELQRELMKTKETIGQIIQHLIDEGVVLKGMKFKNKTL